MNERTFVVIFFFWAILTIITPTLILLSESSKPDLLQFNVDRSGGLMNARRMIDYSEKQLARKIIRSAPAPAPVLEPVFRTRWSSLRKFFKKL
ncbi:uncharacterized protein LOC126665786 [Mercurialis annua]|uniref:uncharacterized protein LOC126665786 n=1 Tax=Mercurialis annua TaxID=3986 RepID=UPI00215F9673|nr:uncharacterized protein LOC126665786 [Mercurialis annua]